MTALDGRSGKKKWEFKKEEVEQLTEPAVGPDGTVFVACERGRIFVINPKTGKKTKTISKGAERHVFPPVMSPGGALYLGGPSVMYSLERDTGKVRWKLSLDFYKAMHHVVSADGKVIADCLDTLYGIERPTYDRNAHRKWSFSTEKNDYLSSTFGPDGNLYAACRNGKVYVLDPDTGEEKLVLEARGDHLASPALSTDGIVYACGAEGLVALHPDRKELAKARVRAAMEETAEPGVHQTVHYDDRVVIDGISLPVNREDKAKQSGV